MNDSSALKAGAVAAFGSADFWHTAGSDRLTRAVLWPIQMTEFTRISCRLSFGTLRRSGEFILSRPQPCPSGGIQNLGALGCILTGNPAYYKRFGFEIAAANCPENEPQEYFMLKTLNGEHPEGRFKFHEVFYEST